MKVPFSPPDITEEDVAAVAAALRSGWITTGPRVKRFERELAAYCGARRAVCLGSATAALELTLRLLGVGPGDEVVTTAYTYTASASVILHVGARPVLADVAPGSYLLDCGAAERAFTPRTKAVIAVDVAGAMCDYPALLGLAERKRPLFRPASPLQARLGRAAVIADAAHSLGASRGGAASGAAADFTCFSFHAVKNLTTGEGGAALWNPPGWDGEADDALYRGYQLLSLHGQDKDALAKNGAGGWEYDVLLPGWKCNMTDLQAALGLSQLARYPATLARRRALAARYDEAFAGLPVRPLPREGPGFCTSAHLYPLRLAGRDRAFRDRLIAALAAEGVAANVHYKPLPLLSAYRALGYRAGDCPNALALYEQEITLPLFSAMTEEQQGCVVGAFRRLLGAA